MSLTFSLIIEILMLLEITRRFRFVTAVHLVILYVICSQIAFFFGNVLIDDPGPESRLTYLFNQNLGIWTYFLIAVIAYSSSVLLAPAETVSTRQVVKQLAGAASRFVPYVAGGCALFVFFQLSVIDYSSMMFHAWYGAAPPRFDSSALSAAFKLYSLFAILSAASLPLAWRSGSRLNAFVLTVTTSWLFLYSLSSASRGAAVMIFAFAAAWLATTNRNHIPKLAASVVVLLLVMQSALTSRGLGEFGLSSLPHMIGNAFDLSGTQLRYVIVNLFQGIFTTTDGLTVSANFNPIYSWLSFSPLPSGIDGFDKVLRNSEIRLGLYVPMSAIAEAYNFGPIFLVIAIFTLWLSLRSTLISLSKGYAAVSLFTSLMLFAFFVQANAYPMRNTYRPFLAVIAINFLVMFFFRKNNSAGPLRNVQRKTDRSTKPNVLAVQQTMTQLPPIRW